LAQQTIEVLIAATLPTAIRIGKVVVPAKFISSQHPALI
jgi:hypothetical protein